MFLSGREIRHLVASGMLVIEPYDAELVGPNGIDLRLGPEYCQILASPDTFDTHDPERVNDLYNCLRGDGAVELKPNQRYLLHTLEHIELPGYLIGLVNLRSTYARLGLLAPPTVVDAGFRGQLTIEVLAPPYPLRLHAGEPIVHLVLAQLTGYENYKGRYQGQRGVTLPRLGV